MASTVDTSYFYPCQKRADSDSTLTLSPQERSQPLFFSLNEDVASSFGTTQHPHCI